MTLFPLKMSFSQSLKQLPQLLLGEALQELPRKQKDESLKGDIRLYHAHNLETCDWPQTPDGQYAQKVLTPLIKEGVKNYIENIQTDLRVLVWDQLVLPLTVNEAEFENSYVCSPYSYFISYASQSLGFLKQKWIFYSIHALLSGAGKVLRYCQVNKVVTVNNWLFSTNLYPSLEPHQLTAIVHFLQQQFPDHAIVFRSVDPYTSPICYQTLQQLEFDYIASREIFFLDPCQSNVFETRLFKSDIKLLKNSGYEVIDGNQLAEKDFPRLLDLYQDLYIHKYSNLNPNFNEKFLRLLLNQKLMRFKALKKEGRIDGVVGYVERNGMMQCPIFGYDRRLPQEVSLYRLLSTVLMLEAYNHQLFFHQSSGASMFKKIRKAHSCIEYTAVYCRHLNLKRQIPWFLLQNLYNSIGKRYMTRY